MAPAIREQITRELGVEPILINSALVSAQNRQRLYWTNIPGVEQPKDLGILVRDILESGLPLTEKGYCLKASYFKASAVNAVDGGHFPAPMAAEPIRIGTIENDAKNPNFDSQQYRVYSPDGKSVTICGQGGGVGAKTGLYAIPIKDEKVGIFPNATGQLTQCQSKRIYSVNAKGRCLNAGPGGLGVQTGLYAVPAGMTDGKSYPIYKVQNGQIDINGKQYPIQLSDGFYIIRKLTVTECKRLQTVPDSYIFPVSNTQAYKMLGNGWTVDVIAHILSYCPSIKTEPVEVLSMYDGMSCGHIALDKLGAHITSYFATEIDKYAIATTQENYPSTIQLGDAFQVRDISIFRVSEERR